MAEELRLKSTPVLSTYFDWENVNSYQGLSMPWNTGTDKFIPDEWKHSHPKSEGWELLYNTLDLNLTAVPKFFALYNKYLGIIRFFYIHTENVTAGQKYSMAIVAKGTTSIFNFETNDYQPWEMKLTDPSLIKTQQLTLADIQGSQGFMPNAWYGTQLEIAYEDLTQKSDIDIYLTFLPYKSIIQNINLSGQLAGDIKGTITSNAQSSSGMSLVDKLTMNITNKKGSVTMQAGSAVEKAAEKIEKAKQKDSGFFSKLWTKIKTDIPDASISAIVSSIKTHVVTKGIKWATNPLGSFVDSILGIANSSSETTPIEKVDLKINANLNLNGSITYDEVLGNFDLSLPGTSYVRGGYSYPCSAFTDDNLGVWTVKNFPEFYCDITNIIYRENGYALASPKASIVRYSRDIADHSEIFVNPAVLRDCDIEYQNIEYVLRGNFNTDNVIPFPPRELDISYYSPYSLEAFNYSDYESYIYAGEYTENFENHIQTPPLSVEAHVTLVLKHKITGKIFTHKKKFNLDFNTTKSTFYSEITSGGGEEPA